jgi:putative mRNA 3-end processing factor
MNLSYQNANPYAGRESVLVRIDGLLADQTVCILIDSGDGVDVDEMLADDEYLTAVCLTHAHLDHYRTLGENLQDGAQVYAAPDTARILEDVYEAGARYHDFNQFDQVLDSLKPLEDWTTIVNGLRVRPLPAGHTPGAASLLFAIEDDGVQRTVLATGDFSTRRAAGYPGFSTDLPIDIDVLLLSAASNTEFEAQVTEALGTIYERARDGSTVLVTAGGLKGVHLGYLLGHFASDHAAAIPIQLVGQTATLYERLSYDVPEVTTTTEFTDTSTVLEPGGVTIAGPDVPTVQPGTSSARLFETIKDDPGATLIQIPASGEPPVQTATCTVHQYSLSNHPTRPAIDSVVESLEPIHVVILHQTGPEASQYKDKFDSFVWATNDNKQYTLLNENGWTPPTWVSEWTEQRVAPHTESGRRQLSDVLARDETGLLFPSIDRQTTPDLAAEGVAIEQLTDRFQLRVSDSSVSESSPEATAVTTSTPPSPSTAPHSETEIEPTETPAVAESLSSIDERLAQVESTLGRRHYSARVLDVQDGVMVLRLDTELDGVETGDTLDVLEPNES